MKYYFIHYMNKRPGGFGFGCTTVISEGFLNADKTCEHVAAGIAAYPEDIIICNFKELTEEEYNAFNA